MKTIAQRGYARNEREEAILLNHGLKSSQVYVEGRGAETLTRIHMRRGELLATVNGLRALGDSRHDIVAAVRQIHTDGAAIFDIETGHRSDQHGVEMLHAALARIKGELTMKPGQAQAMQRESVRTRIGRRMPAREALTHWRNPRLTTGEAIKHMPGWSATVAYMRLGKRGLPPGRLG